VPGAEAGPLVIVNPLGVGLHHYVEELAGALASRPGAVVQLSAVEPSSRPDSSRLTWLREYAGLLRQARRLRPSRVVIVWPTLGYWDFLLARLLTGRVDTWIVLHDPRPLVYARGYGRLARRLASLRPVRAQAIVHSRSAAECVAEDAALRRSVLLPHPIKLPSPAVAPSPEATVVVRVLGQYKADRDVSALERVAADGPSEWRYEIVGRGWPEVAGWEVSSRFVPEDEFDALVDSANVVVIPYRRFFQSGVALRALERSTPFVGPRGSSLAELVGAESPWLVDDDRWLPAVRAAIADGGAVAHEVAAAEHARVVAAWTGWADG
jgi:hypothetical protein